MTFHANHKNIWLNHALMLCGLRSGPDVSSASWQGLDHVMFVTAIDKKLLLRQYHIQLKKSGTKVRTTTAIQCDVHWRLGLVRKL